MGDDITIGVTEIVNNIEVTAQPNDQIVDISVIDNADDVTLNITPTVIEINVNKGSSYAKWGTILGTLSDQTDLQDALDLKADLVDGKVPSSQLPSYVDDVIEVANYASLPAIGESGKIYLTIDNNHIFRWTGSTYVEITDNTSVWGAITGTLSNQTDLQSALNTKVPYSGATGNVNLGEYGLTSGYIGFDATPTSTPTGIGTMYWDTANRTVSLIDGDGDTTLQIGQEQRILVHNNTGSTLTDGQVVYVTGSTGNLPSVALASATIESTSAATIGVVTESISNGSDGFITTSGIVNGLNTLAFNEGDLLWLGTTAGTFSTTKPTSPNHLVLIGYVIKKAGGNGSILVKIQNTQELDECSDVLFSGLANNDLLVYETASALWKNKSLATVLGYTPANDSNVVHLTGNETIAGVKTFSTQIKSNILFINESGGFGSITGYTQLGGTADYFQVINGTNTKSTKFIHNGSRNLTMPAADGTLALTSDLHNPVTIGTANGLSLSTQVLSLGLASSSTNGSLSSTDWNTFNNKQNALTNPITGTGTIKYIPKFIGASEIGNSQIFDNGTNVGIGTTSPGEKISVAGNIVIQPNGSLKFGTVTSGTNVAGISQVNGFGLKFGVYKAGGVGTLGTDSLDALNIQENTGNVGIGTTSPSEKLTISNGKLALTTDDVTIGGKIYGYNDTSVNLYSGGLKFQTRYFDGSNYVYTDRLTINSSGNVGIGTTSPSSKLDVVGSSWVTNMIADDAVGNSIFIRFNTSVTSNIGSITRSGSTSAVSYNTTSDYRLKEDFKNYSGLDLISNINTYDFKWKNSEDRMYGVIAHELQEVVPYAVNGEKDAEDMQQVDYSKLVPILVEAIKELKAEIEILKNK